MTSTNKKKSRRQRRKAKRLKKRKSNKRVNAKCKAEEKKNVWMAARLLEMPEEERKDFESLPPADLYAKLQERGEKLKKEAEESAASLHKDDQVVEHPADGSIVEADSISMSIPEDAKVTIEDVPPEESEESEESEEGGEPPEEPQCPGPQDIKEMDPPPDVTEEPPKKRKGFFKRLFGNKS